jgi:hypothetical protein
LTPADHPSGLTDSSVPPSRPRPLRAICLDGGGYLGLATASFLAEVERHHRVATSEVFDLFCGTSTGGIIALALAHGMTGQQIVDLYRRLGREVFDNRVPGVRFARKLRGLFVARYSNKPLRRALSDAFGETRLGELRQRGKFVVVPAFCLDTGTPRVFKTDHCDELSRDDQHFVRDIALATSAAPLYLPIASIKSPTTGTQERFIDGGVYANNPTLLAFTEAIGYLKRPAEQIRLLSIATPRDLTHAAERSRPLTRWQRFRLNRGLIGWGFGLADLFIGSSMRLTHFAVNRVMLGMAGGMDAYHRVELRTQKGLALDVATEWATQTLINIGSSAAAQSDERERLRPFFRGG